ncbi:MAG: O-antigen ligase family protein [Candidatus Levybacteria bacterium]|nr:O-antigen ligase family protein [Candidatus Levybacteria bacterium]
MKIVRWIQENILFVFTLFLLTFIPLYPKLPLIDVKNTWVYIRIEDFLVVFVLFFWLLLLVRKKITLKTPLTLPIFVFWIVGAIATIHGVILIFPQIAGVFPNVALLSFLRRIEYLSVFFVAYAGMRDKRFLFSVIGVLIATLLLIVLYGFGQKYLGFPAFLTMNEEFAKGEPIKLSALSRVPSTFAGHYDLAAYLVLVVPLVASLFFGFRNWLIRVFLAVCVGLGFVLLFMTVSRVSFVVLLISLVLMLFLQKQKIAILSVVLLAFLAPIFVVQFTPALLERFGNTVKEVDVLVDAKTGEPIGQAKIVPKDHFRNSIILRRTFQEASSVDSLAVLKENELSDSLLTSFFPIKNVPEQAVLVVPPNAPTGENLPQGTAYINLSLSPVVKRLGEFFYEDPSGFSQQASGSAISYIFHGNFLIKKASAYDLSFTTRFQGEWPHALAAFKRNILFGSGYGSVSLAVDNNYLRLLGEVGILGLSSFLTIFVVTGIYIRKILPEVTSKVARSFILGFIAGTVGLLLNGILIDVFEASKVAFVLWLLTGITLGLLTQYQEKPIHFYKELTHAMTSTYAIIVYLLIVCVVLFSPMIRNYFVADDYTWLRWAADCGSNSCPSALQTVFQYFTSSDGFFYRPGTKTFFFFMYPIFWLNQNVYHIVSLSLHFLTATIFFLLARKILRSKLLAVLTAFLFLLMSGYGEIVFWISAIGHMFNALFILLSLYLFILWDEKKRMVYFIGSMLSFIASLLFYELGVVVPLLIILYKITKDSTSSLKKILVLPQYLVMLIPIVLYLVIRFAAGSHWSGGDYSYNLLKLPFNIVGNLIGYILLITTGPISLQFYQLLRNTTKVHLLLAFIVIAVVVTGAFFIGRLVWKKFDDEEKKTIVFGSFFFLIALLPFLGFGNIASRYSYVATFGFLLLIVIVLKKMYHFLLSNGRDIAFAGVAAIISVFCLVHVIQVQQMHSDWYEAGKKIQRFFIALDSSYADYWSKEPMRFHFVNVPEKVGQAWVFPVGLSDAIWFVFRNPDIHVDTSSTYEDALRAVGTPSVNEKIFEFGDSGDVVEKPNFRDEQ